MAAPLPNANDASVILTNPTHDEQRQTWRATHPSWGPGLTEEQYLDREAYLLTTPLARDGGLTPWILTDSAVTSAAAARPVLSSCETLKKRAVVAGPQGGAFPEVTAHGVASVFTYPACRSRGYAGRMMALLGEALAREEQASPGAAAFSILYSDVGPEFYANHQWIPMGNTHLEFPVAAASSALGATTTTMPTNTTELRDEHLAALTARDEELLRAQLSKPLPASSSSSSSGGGGKVRAAILPDLNTFEWQYRREDHMLRHFLGRNPSVRGALYTPPGEGGETRRIWGFWVRSRYGGAEGHPVVTILHFLRLVVEDEAATSDAELAAAMQGIMAVAQREAREASCRSIEIWNPPARVLAAFNERLPQLEGKVVEREASNLASFRWFREGSVDDIEWVANEKYAWC